MSFYDLVMTYCRITNITPLYLFVVAYGEMLRGISAYHHWLQTDLPDQIVVDYIDYILTERKKDDIQTTR